MALGRTSFRHVGFAPDAERGSGADEPAIGRSVIFV